MPTLKINFTKSALEAIPAPATGVRLTVRDTQVRGLELRVTASGYKTFSLLRWIPVTQEVARKTIGRFPDLSIEQARKAALKEIALIASGENPAEQRRQARAEMTLGEFFALYLERHSKAHNRTWREDQEKFDRYFASNTYGPRLADKRLSAVTKADITALHARIGAKTPVPANRALALLSSMFNRAIDWEIYRGANPAKGVKKFKETSRDRYLIGDEVPRFFAALEKELNPTMNRPGICGGSIT